MPRLSLLACTDVQRHLADHLRQMRKAAKLSRDALAEVSGVPAATIKRFETTAQISLRQWLLLWQCLDELEQIDALTRSKAQPQPIPRSIEEVLAQ